MFRKNKSKPHLDPLKEPIPEGFVPKVAVFGIGVVGGALADVLDVMIPGKGTVERHDKGASRSEADLNFICVYAPFTAGNGFDGSAVVDATSRTRPGSIVAVRSTVPPDFMVKLADMFPDRLFCSVPEFLDADTAFMDTARPFRAVIGVDGRRIDSAKAEDVLRLLVSVLPVPKSSTYSFKDIQTPMAVKLAANAFFTVKNVFFNQFADLCMAAGLPFQEAADAVSADPRIGSVHAKISSKGGRGAGGRCLPKDMEIYRRWADGLPSMPTEGFLRSVSAHNRAYLRSSSKDSAISDEVYGTGSVPVVCSNDASGNFTFTVR